MTSAFSQNHSLAFFFQLPPVTFFICADSLTFGPRNIETRFPRQSPTKWNSSKKFETKKWREKNGGKLLTHSEPCQNFGRRSFKP
jgi:hypothetical protein